MKIEIIGESSNVNLFSGLPRGYKWRCRGKKCRFLSCNPRGLWCPMCGLDRPDVEKQEVYDLYPELRPSGNVPEWV